MCVSPPMPHAIDPQKPETCFAASHRRAWHYLPETTFGRLSSQLGIFSTDVGCQKLEEMMCIIQWFKCDLTLRKSWDSMVVDHFVMFSEVSISQHPMPYNFIKGGAQVETCSVGRPRWSVGFASMKYSDGLHLEGWTSTNHPEAPPPCMNQGYLLVPSVGNWVGSPQFEQIKGKLTGINHPAACWKTNLRPSQLTHCFCCWGGIKPQCCMCPNGWSDESEQIM